MLRRSVMFLSIGALALSVLSTLLFGSTMHALIPHDHGEGRGEMSIWNSLHASLRHEDKKATIVPLALPAIETSLLVLLVLTAASLAYIARAHSIEDPIRDALRRGVVAHRMFR